MITPDWYASFGQQYAREPHPSGLPLHPDGVLALVGYPDEGEARSALVEVLGGPYWSNLYSPAEWSESKSFFPRGVTIVVSTHLMGPTITEAM